jgi:hypothetical protein
MAAPKPKPNAHPVRPNSNKPTVPAAPTMMAPARVRRMKFSRSSKTERGRGMWRTASPTSTSLRRRFPGKAAQANTPRKKVSRPFWRPVRSLPLSFRGDAESPLRSSARRPRRSLSARERPSRSSPPERAHDVPEKLRVFAKPAQAVGAPLLPKRHIDPQTLSLRAKLLA